MATNETDMKNLVDMTVEYNNCALRWRKLRTGELEITIKMKKPEDWETEQDMLTTEKDGGFDIDEETPFS